MSIARIFQKYNQISFSNVNETMFLCRPSNTSGDRRIPWQKYQQYTATVQSLLIQSLVIYRNVFYCHFPSLFFLLTIQCDLFLNFISKSNDAMANWGDLKYKENERERCDRIITKKHYRKLSCYLYIVAQTLSEMEDMDIYFCVRNPGDVVFA